MICLMIIPTTDKYMYLYSMHHIDYFIWLIHKVDNLYLYSIIFFCAFIYTISFPIIAFFIPHWDTVLDLHGCLYSVALTVSKDSVIPYKMQSKIFWYNCFQEHGIKTPKVYFHIIEGRLDTVHILKKEQIQNMTFILKPTYGTQGRNIHKIKGKELVENKKLYSHNDSIIQEYIRDCFVDTARHFRINTVSYDDKINVFSVDERKQTNKEKIASNHANGADITFCKKTNCDFLTDLENLYIQEICDQLIQLHRKEFRVVPLIGWDVCLTCNGPYVFEGNLGADIEPYNYKEYMKMIDDLYTK